MNLAGSREEHAGAWIGWARASPHDGFEYGTWPALRELLPAPGPGPVIDLPARHALAGHAPVCLSWQHHRPMGVPVLHELDYDDSDSPSIGLVPPGVTWEDVYDHIKIAHHPLLVVLDDGTDHVGAYWDGTKMIVAEDLGPDQDEAVAEFRELLRERGEH